jgi:hypothetical protein
MPAINHTPVNVTSDSASKDVFGISSVSGFYGTGAWAASILALMSSWYAIIWCTAPKGNRDTLPHLLYTNWAAVDLFRQMGNDEVMFAPLAAAVTITFWGLLHADLQLLLVFIRICTPGYSPCSKSTLPFLLFGIAVPSIVLLLFVSGIQGENSDPAYVLVVLPKFTDHKIISAVWVWTFPLVALTTFLSFLFVSLEGEIADVFFEDYPLNVALSTVTWGLPFLFFMHSPSSLLGFSIILFGPQSLWGSKSGCTVFKPCAPQSIGEWDQAFTVICALAIFLYELGPELVTSFCIWIDRSYVGYMSTIAA